MLTIWLKSFADYVASISFPSPQTLLLVPSHTQPVNLADKTATNGCSESLQESLSWQCCYLRGLHGALVLQFHISKPQRSHQSYLQPYKRELDETRCDLSRSLEYHH